MVRKQAQGQNVFASAEKTWCYHLSNLKAAVQKSKLMQIAGHLPYLFCLEVILIPLFNVFLAHQRVKFYQATSRIQALFVKQLHANPKMQ